MESINATKVETGSKSPGELAWYKFKRNRLGKFGLVVLGLAVLIALFGSNIRPDGSKDANSQQISLSRKPMNFMVMTLCVERNEIPVTSNFFQGLFFGSRPRTFEKIPLHSFTISGDSLLGFKYGGESHIRGEAISYHIVDIAFALGPSELITKTDSGFRFKDINDKEHVIDKMAILALVEEDHLVVQRYILGTDKFGRDLLSRLMAGTIVSLSVGLISVAISLLLGVSLGAIAGYFGGWVDDVITWLINVIWSIPTLLLVIAITFALGKGFTQVFIAVGLTMWVEVARIVRGQMLAAKNFEYVEAARVLGFPNHRIIVKHILPNIFGPVIVISSANFASAILLEAGLSFLGIGAQIPMASWGQMIKEHYAYITTNMAYLAVLPGLCILLLVMAFMLIGDALRESFDYRQG